MFYLVSFEMMNTCILIFRFETWITRNVSKISACNGHQSLAFSKMFPMIPNTWQCDLPEDDFV